MAERRKDLSLDGSAVTFDEICTESRRTDPTLADEQLRHLRKDLEVVRAQDLAGDIQRKEVSVKVFSCMLRRAKNEKVLRAHGIAVENAKVIDMTKYIKRDPEGDPLWSKTTGLAEEVRKKLSQDPGMKEALAEASEHYLSDSSSGIVVFACNKGKHRSVAAAELFAEKHQVAVRHLTVVEHLREQGCQVEDGKKYIENSYAAACDPPALTRQVSEEYGVGASKYDGATLLEWKALGQAGMDALQRAKKVATKAGDSTQLHELQTAADRFRASIALRPDFAKGYLGLASALLQLRDSAGAAQVLDAGHMACPGHTEITKQRDKIVVKVPTQPDLICGAELLEWSSKQKPVNEHDRIAVSRITSEVYLGSRFGIFDGSALLLDSLRDRVMAWSGNSLAAVVNVASLDCTYDLPPGCAYYPMPVKDHHDAQILPLLDAAVDFMQLHVSHGGACFVHCMGGYSRSASVVIAYLIKHRALSYMDARRVAEKGRPQVKPNDGFVNQLLEFERHCSAKKK